MSNFSGRKIVIALLVVACIALGVGIGIGRVTAPDSSDTSSSSSTSSDSSAGKSAETPAPTMNSTESANSTTSETNTTTSETNTSSLPSIMLVGDSITDPNTAPTTGWPVLLQAEYTDRVDVLNRGRTGYNTNLTVFNTIPDVTKELETMAAPLVITLWLGNNDAAIIGGNYQEKHVSIDDFKRNLVTSIFKLRSFAPSSKIVLITPNVIDNATRFKVLTSRGQVTDPLDRSLEEAGKYATASREVAAVTAGLDVSLLDLYQYLMDTYPVTEERNTLLADGLHYSDKGHIVVTQQLVKHIQELLPSEDVLSSTPAPTTANI